MTTQQPSTAENALSGFIRAAGVILAISYPVLALSTGARAIYQLFFKEGVTDFMPPLLSARAGRAHGAWLAHFLAVLGPRITH